MPAVVKLIMTAAVSVVVLGTVGTVTWMNIHGAPHCLDLSSDSNFTGTYNDKYVSDYAKYFVGVDNNIKWWDWSFKYRYSKIKQEEIKEKFKNKSNGTDLKNACKEAYKVETNKVTEKAENNDEYKEKDIWTFCSIGGNKPKSLNEEDVKYGSNNFYIKDSIARKYLISTGGYENNWFWAIKEKEFFNTKLEEFKGESDFKLERTKHFYRTPSLKRVCLRAYHSDKTKDTAQYPKAEIYKFCSLSGKEPPSSSSP